MAKYKKDDLLTLEQVADHLGYQVQYLRALNCENGPQSDPLFRRLRIKTDPSWREAFGSSVHYVYEYSSVMDWFRNHQEEPTVKTFNESRGIVVDL